MQAYGQQLSGRQEQRQTQKFVLSSEMKQALEVLRMPLGELYTYVNTQLQENPLLEIDPDPPAQAEEAEDTFATLNLPDESLPDTRQQIWEEQVGAGLFAGLSAGGGENGGPDVSRLTAREGETLAGALREQLAGMRLEAGYQNLCEYLIDCLDRRGYFDFELGDLAAETGAPLFELEQALYILQSLDPAGVAARSLEECLVLQLERGRDFNAYTVKLVKEGLPLLAANEIKGLAGLLGCGEEEAARWAGAVRRLNPIPAQGYAGGEGLSQLVPDAAVLKDGGSLRVTVNRGALPRLELSADYCALLKQKTDQETGDYLRERCAAAQSLISAVEEREGTLGRILKQLAERQPEYFADGQSLHPLTMSDLARELDMHVSTVSRAVQDKYVICAAGTVPLRALFTSKLSATGGGEAVSSAAARRAIALCVKGEDKAAPLSDEEIRQVLAARGIALSRRTVAKYREEMGVLPSSKRKLRGLSQ